MTKTKKRWSFKVGDLKPLLRWPKKLGAFFKKLSRPKKVVFTSLSSLGILVFLYLIYCLAFIGRVYPNIYVGSYSFSHVKTGQVQPRLEGYLADMKEPIKLTFNDQVYSLNPSDIDYSMNLEATAQRIVNRGRDGSAWQILKDQLSSLFVRHRVEVVASYDRDELDTFITNISETIDQPAVDASAKFVGDELVVTNAAVGKRINRTEVKEQILSQWGSFSPSTIALELRYDVPKIVVGSQDELGAQTSRLSASKLTLTWSNTQKTLNVSEIRQMIGFIGVEPKTPIFDNGVSQQTLTAAFTIDSIKGYLVNLATTIDVPAKDPKLIIKDGVLAVSQTSQNGQVVDKEASATSILEALNSGNPGPVALTIRTQAPVITEEKLAELGIKERIGYGTTSFAGSPANRKANILNGVRLLSSALIKPGEEFSTVNTLGAVDGTTGFLPELVIKENQTVPEYGGGLCQVSTTLFRSVLNAGLKVTARSNHSYRVSYYEPPVGLDATIYLPKPDFKFLNDTGAYILVQGRVEGTKVIFELWGTSDGRTSTITDPIISNITEPGDPVYVETDTLFKGETKQTEKAHQGATTVVYYTVSRGGQVINKQTFKSVYKAWTAKYLVGTKDPPADGSAPQ